MEKKKIERKMVSMATQGQIRHFREKRNSLEYTKEKLVFQKTENGGISFERKFDGK